MRRSLRRTFFRPELYNRVPTLWLSIFYFIYHLLRDEEGADPGLKEIPVPTPEMVRAQFPTAESIVSEQEQQVTSQLR